MAILLLAMVFDLLLGDPKWLYRLLPHPVVLIGRGIARLENLLNRQQLSRDRRILLGLLCTAMVVLGCAAIGLALHSGLQKMPFGWILEAILASSLLAFRGLYDAVKAVANGLADSLEAGRSAVGHIVGRDPNSLDHAGVARAAAESAAENFSDGFVAPVFWYLLLGFPGLLAYKAINTLDSMIGHRNARYEAFGKGAAKLDDLANYLPARLAGLLFIVAALLVPGANAGSAWRSMLRDAPRHRSPNAGWQEAALAGGLGLALAGPRHYAGQLVEDAWMGDGRSAVTVEDLGRVLDLYLAAGGLLFALLAAALLMV
ncbi:cobalamin biosynthesis protein CobD [Pelagibius litoralis]|uniref:Cobalamin biosynthesis protein CobD n=2 Tax=Pelagibius litoralis TaxID=374515 RepID=A0A967CA41_9PROT|nr:cobalamin biosynthesis protein CobD [Pelagibius litoralis]